MAFNVTEILDSSIGVGNITLGNVLYFAIALIIGVIVAKVVSINARRLLAERLPKNESELLTKLIYYIIILWAFVIALPQLSFDLSGLLVAGGVAGLVIGFASQSVVSNLISGLFLMFEQPIKLGDNVNIAGINGIVEDIRVLSTVLKTYDGIYVRIPNEKAFTSNITNYVNNPARRFTYQIPIRYKDDVDAAIRITKEVIAAHPFALKNPAPMVFLDSIGDRGLNLDVRIWTPAWKWWDVRIDLLLKIRQALEANGIDVPLPQRILWFADDLGIKNPSAEGYEIIGRDEIE